MKFWDSSAVVPLIVREPESSVLEAIAKADQKLVVWWGTQIECASALARRRWDGALNDGEERMALDLLSVLVGAWTEVSPTLAVRETAMRLSRVHQLRAADAVQLGAALEWVSGWPSRAELVTRDDRLALAAEREGFAVV